MNRLGILEFSSDVVFITDPDGLMVESNAAFRSTFGAQVGEGSIRRIWPEIGDFLQPALDAHSSSRELRVDVTATNTKEREIIFDVRLYVVHEPETNVESIVGVARDVSADREETRRLEVESTTDGLTGVFNRHQLEVLLAQGIRAAIRRKSTGCFLFLDIDQFKDINDSLGHAEGDRVLKAIANVLVDNLRGSDIVARFGGDEFGVILTDATLEWGLIKASQLADALRGITPTGAENGIQASIGVAAYPEHGDYVADIIKRADAAMYKAKRHSDTLVLAWDDSWAT